MTEFTERAASACGTTAGYHRHIRWKNTPCDPCRQAMNAAARERRAVLKGCLPVERRVLAELYLGAEIRLQEKLERKFGSDVLDAIVLEFDRGAS